MNARLCALLALAAFGIAALAADPEPPPGGDWPQWRGPDRTGISKETGMLLWKKDFKKDFSGGNGRWDYAESPLIDGGRVVVTPGGDKATIVALDKESGKELLRAPVTGLAGKGRGGYSTAAYAS